MTSVGGTEVDVCGTGVGVATFTRLDPATAVGTGARVGAGIACMVGNAVGAIVAIGKGLVSHLVSLRKPLPARVKSKSLK